MEANPLSEPLRISGSDTNRMSASIISKQPQAIETTSTTSSSATTANVSASISDVLTTQLVDVNIMLTIVYLAIFFIGVVGNICNCIVIADSRNKYMKTATNYYLFSLSVSDLLLLIFGLPHDIVNLWHPSPYMFNQFVCISRGWISEASTNASVLVIVAFTVERYLAICHPLRAHTLSRLSRSVKIIISIWLIASSCALIVVMQYGVILISEKRPNGQEVSNAQCTTVQRNETIFELSVFVFFIVPMAVITILYVKLGCHLRQKTHLIKQNQIKRQQRLFSVESQQPSIVSGSQVSPCNLNSVNSTTLSANNNNNNNITCNHNYNCTTTTKNNNNHTTTHLLNQPSSSPRSSTNGSRSAKEFPVARRILSLCPCVGASESNNQAPGQNHGETTRIDTNSDRCARPNSSCTDYDNDFRMTQYELADRTLGASNNNVVVVLVNNVVAEVGERAPSQYVSSLSSKVDTIQESARETEANGKQRRCNDNGATLITSKVEAPNSEASSNYDDRQPPSLANCSSNNNKEKKHLAPDRKQLSGSCSITRSTSNDNPESHQAIKAKPDERKQESAASEQANSMTTFRGQLEGVSNGRNSSTSCSSEQRQHSPPSMLLHQDNKPAKNPKLCPERTTPTIANTTTTGSYNNIHVNSNNDRGILDSSQPIIGTDKSVALFSSYSMSTPLKHLNLHQHNNNNSSTSTPSRHPHHKNEQPPPIALNSTVNTANMQSVIKMLGFSSNVILM